MHIKYDGTRGLGLMAAMGVPLFAGLLAAACSDDPATGNQGGAGGQGASGGAGGGDTGGAGGSNTGGGNTGGSAYNPMPSPYDNDYFDPPPSGGYADDYTVVGSITPPSWSWGKIELLEGHQKYRTEGYNLRTQKLRWQDTFQDSTYPLRTYFGSLNQQLVDGFNLHYKDACAGKEGQTNASACGQKGPQRPEARFVLLHHGPKTAAGMCDKTKSPVLLVHGALQNGNVWISPGGNDGQGNAFPGTTQKTGFVQELESQGYCTYAVTYGSFHGDNFNQAINLSNALRRVEELTGKPKVNVVAWSKGVLSADLYMANVSSWGDFGPRYFEQLAAVEAKNVPAFRKDVRTYVALSGPHLGIDLNFRHPYDDLLIYSTAESAPIGQGPVTWSWMSAVQCVTWGFADSPGGPYPNPYAYSVCEKRGSTWLDYWTRIYSSNITALDAEGKPVADKSLKDLNVGEGVDAAKFDFDMYNIAMWGSVDESGKYVSAYIGQMQVAYDLRPYYPIPNRQDDPASSDWSQLDTDETKWREWLAIKLNYNPFSPTLSGAGYVDDDSGHVACRATAYEPDKFPCLGQHLQNHPSTSVGAKQPYTTYKLMDSIGIKAVMEMGGNLIERLSKHGLSEDVDFLYVLHGTSPGASVFEIDGMDCPTCDPKGDGVLFEKSVAARDQLTQGWSSANKTSKSKQEGAAFGHLDMGVTPAVWTKMIEQFKALP